jgi:hypothetical protein
MNDNAGGQSSIILPRLYIGSRVLTGAESDRTKILAFLNGQSGTITAPEPTPVLTILTEDVDLDTLPPGKPHDFQIKVRNSGEIPLQLGWVALDQGCEVTQMPSGKVYSGEVASIGIRLTPPAEEGAFNRRLKLHSNAPGEPPAVTVHGRCVTEMAASAAPQ